MLTSFATSLRVAGALRTTALVLDWAALVAGPVACPGLVAGRATGARTPRGPSCDG